MKKKYLVLAGFGESGYGFQFISSAQVALLYGVKEEECYFADPRKEWEFVGLPDGLIILRPDPSGAYQVPDRLLRAVK